jgi:IS605 OrfB family transposase
VLHVAASEADGRADATPSMVVIDTHLARGASNGGLTFHDRGGPFDNITTELARGYTTVTIEDLNVAGMLQLRALARHVSDAAFGQFRRQLEYKAAWYGTELVVADRWFPSSKTCSGCGTINANLTLSDRVYDCGACALVIDRDVNAAVNLARYIAPPPKASPLPAALTRVPRLHPDEPGSRADCHLATR